MRSKARVAAALEDELLRLNALVRERRAQLDRLTDCPNHDCPCRAVWKDHVEKKLAGQVHKIRKQVRSSSRPATRRPMASSAKTTKARP